MPRRGHVLKCPACAHAEIAYNSCRNRDCPKCQGSAARRWLEDRQSDLLPVEYYHVSLHQVVYAKRPFAGPAAVLAYLSRYTHRVAIANSRLVALEQGQVTYRWKDYRAKGRTKHKTMTITAGEFMRRSSCCTR